MSISSTSFSERLARIETSTFLLYAGDEAPQQYKPEI
jgi:hypothetical protein